MNRPEFVRKSKTLNFQGFCDKTNHPIPVDWMSQSIKIAAKRKKNLILH